jgi:hypothetical protein
MLKIVRRLKKNETGAALVEYAAAAIMPGAHADSNAPIVSGKIIETSPNAPGFDEGNSATGIGLDVNAITQSNGQKRLGDNVGGDGSLSSLVLETKNR